jgi:dTDP-4-dehydrorhamnose reductase
MSMRPLRHRRLFVTGGSGFLGRRIVNGPASQSWEVVAPGSGSADLRYRDTILSMVRDWKPAAVIHTAYRKGDRASIVDASANVAEAAVAVGARLVHVSSDAVFAGQIAAYTELDPPSPVTEYGRDKADAEALVARIDPGAVIVRTSLIYGDDELSVHERAVRDAVSGRTDTAFFTDEVRSPVLVGDLAASLVDLATMPEVRGPLHLGGPAPFSRAALAVMTARRHGWDENRLRFSTIAESGLTRSSKVVLDSSRARSHGLAVRGPADLW